MAVDLQARLAALNEIPNVAGLQEIDAPVQREAVAWSDPVRAGVSYFRIPDRREGYPRGRITLLQNGMNAMEMVMHRGYVALYQYRGYKSANQLGDWQRSDPYLGIIQRGGLHEFDAAQIHELKWHHKPTRDATGSHRLVWQQIQARLDAGADREGAVLSVLPQLAGWDLAEYSCKLCPQRVGGAFTTATGLEGHRSIAHKENVQTEGTRDAVSAALKASGGDMTALIEALTAVAQGMAATTAAAAAEPAKRGPGRPAKAASVDDDA